MRKQQQAEQEKQQKREERERVAAEARAAKLIEREAERNRRYEETGFKVDLMKRVKEQRELTRLFPREFEDLASGHLPEDGLSPAEIQRIPAGSMESILTARIAGDEDAKSVDRYSREVMELAMRAFMIKVERFRYKVPLLRRVKDERSLTKQFSSAFENVTCGLTPDDGFTFDELESIPIGTIETILTEDYRRDVTELAMRAFLAQTKRVRLWETDDGNIMRQGTPGFNARTAQVLRALHVTGARECNKVRSDGTREPMLHQATTRALLHPLTPVSRALVIHPTGTGKSFVMISALDNFFYDTRDKVIVVPSYVVQLQIVQDMIQLLPNDRPLKRWYLKWRSKIARTAQTSTDKLNPKRLRLLEALQRYETGTDTIKGDSDYLWYVVAALSFQTMFSRNATGADDRAPRRTTEEEEDERRDGYDKESEDDDVRVPDMFPDRERLQTFDAMTKGEEVEDPWELRSRVVFMTYQDHKLGFYRTHPAFAQRSGRAPAVSFNDKIVLVDEMHNLFDERNPNLNRVQQRKIFGDKALRTKYQQLLEKSTADSDVRRRKEAVLIFSGMKKVMQRCSRCVLIGLTATPIVEGDGTRAALQVLNWIRGRAATATRTVGGEESDGGGGEHERDGGAPSSPTYDETTETTYAGGARYGATGGSTDPLPPPSSPQSPDRPSLRRRRDIDLGMYEGYVSVFGVKPTELFARTDELSYPNLMPILMDVTPDMLEPGRAKREEEDEPTDEEGGKDNNAIPTYGLGRLQSLISKYQMARRADEWFERHSSIEPYAPSSKNTSVHIEYWERSRMWTSNPMLYRASEPMPRWSQDGLRAFGRSLPRVGTCAWLERASKKDSTSWRDTRQPCWIVSGMTFSQTYPLALDRGGTITSRDAVGRGGSLEVEIGNLDRRLVARDAVEGITIHADHVVLKTKKDTHKLRAFDAPLKNNTRRATIDATRNGTKHVLNGVSGDEDPEFYVVRVEGRDDIVVANLATSIARRESQNLDYVPEFYYYEETQLRVLYPRRLAEYKQDEGSYWMNVFYGGRQMRAAQASAVLPESTRVGGILDRGADVSGFAIEMARQVLTDAFSREGKTLWLLHEAHGLALVRRWLEGPEARRIADTSRIRLFGSYRNQDRRDVQDMVKAYLETTYNASPNVDGNVCKLFIGGAGDLGVGVTFTEVRHIYLDLTPSYFNIVQQMGRGARLCKHSRLPEEKRTLTFHLPFPLMTLGWGATPTNATMRNSPGGIGNASVDMNDFVPEYRIGTRRETLGAPLHVPVHAFDSLNDLQRARYQFHAGMQLFQYVAMDADYYREVAGWEPERVNLANEPLDRGKIASMVRELVKRSIPRHFLTTGLTVLQKMSEKNKATNREAAENPPDADDRERRSTHNPQRLRYIEELANIQGKLQKKEIVAQRKEEKQSEKVMKEVKKQEEDYAKRYCLNYKIEGFGVIVHKDRPELKINQKEAIATILEGSKMGYANCQNLHLVLRMLDVVP